MSMSEWAKREVELACKREAPDRKKCDWDYGCACYESALKAYLSLMEDQHSGMSFGFTAGILKRLLEEKPLTPIEDVPDVWNRITRRDDGTEVYQCSRMHSLFKLVDPDGTVKYSDIDRYYCEDANGLTYHSGLEANMLDDLHPIGMPYYPPLGRYVFLTRELLTNRKNGDFDTKAILELKSPDGTEEVINRYFAESNDGWREISYTEFIERAEEDRYRREAEEGGQENG